MFHSQAPCAFLLKVEVKIWRSYMHIIRTLELKRRQIRMPCSLKQQKHQKDMLGCSSFVTEWVASITGSWQVPRLFVGFLIGSKRSCQISFIQNSRMRTFAQRSNAV